MSSPGQRAPGRVFAAYLLTAAVVVVPSLAQDAGGEPVARSSKGMVSGTTGAAAQRAGLAILRAGGTAADASVATAMVQICLAAGSWVSYAGIMNVVYYDSKTNRTVSMNASYDTVEDETDPSSIEAPDFSKGLLGAQLAPSGRNVLVPGFLKGADALVERFGKLPLSEVVQPSIDCATNGFEWNSGLATRVEFRKDVLSRDSDTRAIYFKEDGRPYEAGEVFRQPALAKTLGRFAEGGADSLYEGAWGRNLVAKVSALGGKLSLRDLATYEVLWGEPLVGEFGGYELRMHGLPALGGLHTIETLRLVEHAGLSQRYDEDAKTLSWLSQIGRVSPLLSAAGPMLAGALGTGLSPENRLNPDTTEIVWKALERGALPGIEPPARQPAHSDAVVVVDRWGNMAAMVHSINAVSWGTNGINVGGISIPDSASIQVAVVAATPPGERLPDPTNPGLVLEDGKPFLAFASIGAGLHQRTISGLIGVLQHGQTPQEAINAPALGLYDPFRHAQTVAAGEFDAAMLERAKALGLETIEDNSMRGYWIAIRRDPETGELSGGSPRSLDVAMGGRAVSY